MATQFELKNKKYNENMEEEISCLLENQGFTSYVRSKVVGTDSDQSKIRVGRLNKKGINPEELYPELEKKTIALLNSPNKVDNWLAEEVISKYIKEPFRQRLAENEVAENIAKFGFSKFEQYYYGGKFCIGKPDQAIKSIDFSNGKKIFVLHKQNTGSGGGQTSDTSLEINTLNEFVKNPHDYKVVVVFTGTTDTAKLQAQFAKYPFIIFADGSNYEKILRKLGE
jgi:hypothetical protein